MAAGKDMLCNKVVLITGASSGIGEGTAIEFARHGCRLALTGRKMANLEKASMHCEGAGLPRDKILLLCADITNESDIVALVRKVISFFGQLDILINNAGILSDSNLTEKFDKEKFDQTMRTNLQGPLLLCKEAVPHLIKTKGNIINVSSISGMRPMSGVLFYAMSKAALNQMTQILAVELAPKGVRVNSVNPGIIKTDMHLRSGFSQQQYARYLEEQKILNPIGRYGEVEDVAQAIVYLASDAASFISGILMPIDGGRICVTPRQVNTPAHSKL